MVGYFILAEEDTKQSHLKFKMCTAHELRPEGDRGQTNKGNILELTEELLCNSGEQCVSFHIHESITFVVLPAVPQTTSEPSVQSVRGE